MTRILVPTDFSKNSKAGIRFAAQLAQQNNNVRITFFHHTEMLRNKKLAALFEQMMEEKLEILKKFVSKSTAKFKLKPARYDFAVSTVSSTAESILNYAQHGQYDFISISTRGESVMKKLLGSNTAALLKAAKLPVIAVPATYRTKPVEKIMYITDFQRIDTEIGLISELARITKAKVLAWHAESLTKPIDQHTAEQMLKPFKKQIKPAIFIAPKDILTPLEYKIEKAIRKHKPQIVVMFSRERKGFWEKLLLPSKSAAIASDPKVPMIAMKLS